jgi:hypothetical protein
MNMKKFIMAVIALAITASVASAGIGVLWTISYGAYTDDAPDVTGGTHNLLGSYSAIWQLIFAGLDNTIEPIPESRGRCSGCRPHDGFLSGLG